MDINVTLFGEMITFAVLVWFMMKFVWPPVIKALNDRQQKISDGLKAAERSQKDLELTHQKVAEQLHEAKTQAYVILDQANQQANSIVDEGKIKAQEEGERILATAKNNIEQELIKTKVTLTKQTAEVAVKIAEKILQQNVSVEYQQQLIDKLIKEI